MNFNDYKNSTTQVITLPSGIKAKLRQVQVVSYVLSGSLPNVFNIETGEIDHSRKDDPEEVKELVKNVILDSVVCLIFDDAEFFVVDKPENKCESNEISFSIIKTEDQIQIFTKAFELSVPGGADNIKAFSA